MHGDILLVQRRDELLTETEEQQRCSDEQDQSHDDSCGRARDSSPKQGCIPCLEAAYRAVISLCHAARDRYCDHRRHESQGEYEG